VLLSRFSGPAVANFVARSDLAEIAGQGPLTPDHVIRTKRIPLIGRNLAAYAATYAAYVAANKLRRPGGLTELTGEPRVIVDPELGLLIVGDNAREMSATADVYAHTIDVIDIASRMSGYQALPAGDIFDVEYWELEQAKLSRERSVAVLGGEIALVTGAASGIGRAIASALLAAGAAVVGLDLDGAVVDTFSGPAWFGLACDVTDDEALQAAVLAAVERFGGLDIVVPAAGVFGKSQPIAELDLAGWKRSMDVNAGSIVALLKYVHPYLKRSPDHGRVVLIASKNVVAPGPGASSYSSSKTAAVQVARVAALEWAEDGIRVNMVHPDAVFDTALWTPDLLKERAAKYGLSEEAYKTRNLLRTEVTSAIVANVVRDLCTDVYRATTGAQIPIDGGNERVV
jgi:NAD(P)-dependent dehydrogenase (short-subunit alcohol dehydrogenase family)